MNSPPQIRKLTRNVWSIITSFLIFPKKAYLRAIFPERGKPHMELRFTPGAPEPWRVWFIPNRTITHMVWVPKLRFVFWCSENSGPYHSWCTYSTQHDLRSRRTGCRIVELQLCTDHLTIACKYPKSQELRIFNYRSWTLGDKAARRKMKRRLQQWNTPSSSTTDKKNVEDRDQKTDETRPGLGDLGTIRLGMAGGVSSLSPSTHHRVQSVASLPLGLDGAHDVPNVPRTL